MAGIPGSPSIERPDEHAVGAADELYCWINSNRECNASCPAFDPRCLQHDSSINPCTILNNMRAVSIVLGRLVSTPAAPMPAPPVVPLGGKRL